jgi:hypothetical protein
MSSTSATWSTPKQFEALVGRLLEANGFLIDAESASRLGVDFVVGRESTTLAFAIEVKYYRTARAQIALIDAAATILQTKISSAQSLQGMLVLSCQLPVDMKQSLERKLGIFLVDRHILYLWATKLPEALDELNAMLENDRPPPSGAGLGNDSRNSTFELLSELWSSKEDDRELEEKFVRLKEEVESLANTARNKIDALWMLPTFSRNIVGSVVLPPIDNKGTELVAELRALGCGKTTWPAYENLCDRILRYLFPNALEGWHRQQRTDDGLNRFDYICRIKPVIGFWTFLIEHLDSRYILFEFKNYKNKIKQGEILTTEKYLLEKGLRKVAIILSRSGADAGAIKMTQGAMRESGKLMLVLDDDMLCDMLHKKENGEDPTDLLFDATDKFLLGLPR